MTLVELMVSLAIVLLIVSAASYAYLKLLWTYKSQGAMSESYMANLTGLEVLRYDIEMAGFGLPVTLTQNYSEALADTANTPKPSYNPSLLNDTPSNPPMPFVPGAARAVTGPVTLTGNHSAVLAIKSTTAWINQTSAKWSTITNSSTGSGTPVVTSSDNPFAAGENITVLDDTGTLLDWNLQFNLDYYTNASTLANPSNQQVFYIYGIDPDQGNHGDRMPFNRVDYYLDNSPVTNGVPTIPSYCAQGTYVLYRSYISQTDGTLVRSPLVNCVEDFQVAFGVVPVSGSAVIWQKDLGTEHFGGNATTPMTITQIQQYLREIRVFILYQEGRGKVSATGDFTSKGYFNLGDQQIASSLDSSQYLLTGSNFMQFSTAQLADSTTSNAPQLNAPGFQPTGAATQYRWKIMEIDAKPMNLLGLPPNTIR